MIGLDSFAFLNGRENHAAGGAIKELAELFAAVGLLRRLPQ
jgi:hypothetical protein